MYNIIFFDRAIWNDECAKSRMDYNTNNYINADDDLDLINTFNSKEHRSPFFLYLALIIAEHQGRNKLHKIYATVKS